MARPVTLFTGQWADLDTETMCAKARAFGYDGLELACWGDHFEVAKADDAYCEAKRAVLDRHELQLFSVSAHLVGQAFGPAEIAAQAVGSAAPVPAGRSEIPAAPPNTIVIPVT